MDDETSIVYLYRKWGLYDWAVMGKMKKKKTMRVILDHLKGFLNNLHKKINIWENPS